MSFLSINDKNPFSASKFKRKTYIIDSESDENKDGGLNQSMCILYPPNGGFYCLDELDDDLDEDSSSESDWDYDIPIMTSALVEFMSDDSQSKLSEWLRDQDTDSRDKWKDILMTGCSRRVNEQIGCCLIRSFQSLVWLRQFQSICDRYGDSDSKEAIQYVASISKKLKHGFHECGLDFECAQASTTLHRRKLMHAKQEQTWDVIVNVPGKWLKRVFNLNRCPPVWTFYRACFFSKKFAKIELKMMGQLAKIWSLFVITLVSQYCENVELYPSFAIPLMLSVKNLKQDDMDKMEKREIQKQDWFRYKWDCPKIEWFSNSAINEAEYKYIYSLQRDS